jgi:hypothetical protein
MSVNASHAEVVRPSDWMNPSSSATCKATMISPRAHRGVSIRHFGTTAGEGSASIPVCSLMKALPNTVAVYILQRLRSTRTA